MYSARVQEALEAALAAHAGQVRKGTGSVPYVCHPVHVALILSRLGCAERTIVAGLLHDVVEDCDDWTIERVEAEFGSDVRRIVDDLTEDKSKSWAERKATGVAKAKVMGEEAATVKACDKLHNLSSLLTDLERSEDPEELWTHFNGGKEQTLILARELVEALAPRVPDSLSGQLRCVMAQLEEI